VEVIIAMQWQPIVYFLAAVALIGVTFFLLMRSADKKLNELNSKSKKRR
jgi:preprotein translocase subunit YajC